MKKKLWITICFIFALCGMVLMTVPAQAKSNKNSNDVKYLKALIKEQKKQGATVSDNINNKKEYSWTKQGRLKEINWDKKNLSGKIDISKFKELKYFSCNKNKVTDLNLNTKLYYLQCENNNLTYLDTSKCDLGLGLHCSNNKLKILKIKKGSSMRDLDCSNNQLTNINISGIDGLQAIYLQHNQIKEVSFKDVSMDELNSIYCDESVKLKDVRKDVKTYLIYNLEGVVNYGINKRGLKANIGINLDSESCPTGKNQEDVSNLYKLFAYINNNFGWKGYNFNDSCLVTWNKKSGRLESICLDDMNIKGTLDLNMFPGLKSIKCSNNKITKLKINKLSNLRNIYCYNNKLQNIDFSKNKKIEKINISRNRLTKLNLKGLGQLKSVKCNNNKISYITLKNNKSLQSITCKENKLSKKEIKNLRKKTKVVSDINYGKSKKIIGKKGKSKKDVRNLTSIIKKCNKNGGKLSYNLNSDIYQWDDGHLTAIYWNNRNLKGKLNLNCFRKLSYIEINNNKITNL